MSIRHVLIWVAVTTVAIGPVLLSLASPLLAWRQPIYILAGVAGVISLSILLIQPLLAGGLLPGVPKSRARTYHRYLGIALLVAVLIHVAGLWITSPPDVVDALLFTSPTPFSAWGVIAMWALFCTAIVAALRKTLKLSWRSWRIVHTVLAVVIVGCTVLHAVLIDGTMEVLSKYALCAFVVAASARVLFDPKILARLQRQRPNS